MNNIDKEDDDKEVKNHAVNYVLEDSNKDEDEDDQLDNIEIVGGGVDANGGQEVTKTTSDEGQEKILPKTTTTTTTTATVVDDIKSEKQDIIPSSSSSPEGKMEDKPESEKELSKLFDDINSSSNKKTSSDDDNDLRLQDKIHERQENNKKDTKTAVNMGDGGDIVDNTTVSGAVGSITPAFSTVITATTGLNRQQHLSPPGAYSVTPSGQRSQGQSDGDDPEASNNNEDEVEVAMVSASLVQDITVEAKPAPTDDNNNNNNNIIIRKRNIVIGCFIIIVAVIIIIVVALVNDRGSNNEDDVDDGNNDENPAITSAPSSSSSSLPPALSYPDPTYPPISFEDNITYEDAIQDIILTYASNTSQIEIQNNVLNSSSFQAYQWILHDDNLLQDLFDSKNQTYGFVERVLQRYALATFWYSTNGSSSWLYNNGWMTSTNECDWYTGRVDGQPTCHSNGLYFGLELQFNNVTGTIPNDIFLLRDIEFLSMEVNSMSGSLPTEMGLLSSLMFLVLPFNSFTGTIPTEFGKLTNLEEFALNDNNLSGVLPKEFGNTQMTNLFFAQFFNNPLMSGTIPDTYALIPHLELLQTHPCTNINGTIPEPICDIVDERRMEVIVECSKVDCECCVCFEDEFPPGVEWTCPFSW